MRVDESTEEVHRKFFCLDTDFFTFKWNQEHLKDWGKKLQKMVLNNKDWPSELYSQVAKRTKFVRVKDTTVELHKFEFEETVIAFSDRVKKFISLDESVRQQTLDESMKDLRAKEKGE